MGMGSIWQHFWLADNGRVFDSQQQLLTTNQNESYVDWVSRGFTPTPWPRDDAGIQTYDALQDVLRSYNIFLDLSYYAGHARATRMSQGITVNGLPFSTDPLTYGSLNSAVIYTTARTTDLCSWKLPDGSFITLSNTDLAALHDMSNSFAQSCFQCEDETLAKIEAGTVTTREEVDALFAAVNSVFSGLSMEATQVRHKRTR